MATFPPSPAVSSFCDLLDDDDLDALLAGLGQLSHFATPPLCTKHVADEMEELAENESEDERMDAIDYRRIALHFAYETGECPSTHSHATTSIESLLWRAQLPPELLAVSYNILRRYSILQTLSPDDMIFAADLLTVAAFALTVSYTDDHPPKSAWWAKRICRDRWSASEIDKAMVHVLVTIDWALHHLSAPQAVDRALNILFPPLAKELVIIKEQSIALPLFKAAPMPLRIVIGDVTACWADGQLTPEDTPLCSPLNVPQAYFLPLL
ncbi:hypothetical protein LTR97_005019 [Elasticomyces elasticus]|uniref:Uncharacterized protein n=1 Tax=Elasticomyces elasticus TaxID=574655 RepID=A0AAN8A328_9PEZI|nr:hypothetical protein LTR97_005019 [Elasticomyces elasticus]